MAFSSVLLDREIFGTRWIAWGTFDATGVTGGDVVTGLGQIESFAAIYTGSFQATAPITVNETFPFAGGDITIICDSGAAGLWIAIGYM